MERSILATVALLLALTACGGGTVEQVETPDPSPTASSPAVDEPLPCVPGTEPFTGEAADRFGADQVMAAYCMLADLAFEQERTSLALAVPEQKPRDLRSVEAMLTPAARTRWKVLVAHRAGSPESAVDGLTLHDVRRVPRGYQRADDRPYVYGTRIGPATAAVTRAMLELSFDLETGLVLEEQGDDDGRHSLLPVTRRGTYWLVPDGDGWLIADWDVAFEHGQVRLVTG